MKDLRLSLLISRVEPYDRQAMHTFFLSCLKFASYVGYNAKSFVKVTAEVNFIISMLWLINT